MFEGETDHLVPTTSAVLVESELFVMAGRLIGHSVNNGGPTLSGLSLAVVHALTGGSKELATSYLCLEECPDIDHRETIGLVSTVNQLYHCRITDSKNLTEVTKQVGRQLFFGCTQKLLNIQ